RIKPSRCTISRWPMARASSSGDRPSLLTTTAGSTRHPSRSTPSNPWASRPSWQRPVAERSDRGHSQGARFMLALILAVSALSVAERGDSPLPNAPADRADYEAVRVKAGRDAKAQIRLALWCEAHGLSAERMKHLALAVLYDPSNALARGLMGLVAYRGEWERPEAVGPRIRASPPPPPPAP